MMNKWKRIEPTKTTKVGWRTIVSKRFVMNGGKEAAFDTYGIEGQEFAAVIGVTADNRIVIARQFRTGPEQIMDELPGGCVDAGEDPETAAIREFEEETGYRVGNITHLGGYCKDSYMNGIWHIFYATDCVPTGVQQIEEYEDIEIDTISVAQFIENAKSNKMTDGTGVLMAYDRLQKLL